MLPSEKPRAISKRTALAPTSMAAIKVSVVFGFILATRLLAFWDR
jgi:hypothetical protein